MDTVHSRDSHEQQHKLITNSNQLESSSVKPPPSFTSLIEEKNEFTKPNQPKATSVEQPPSFTSLLEHQHKFKSPKQQESGSVELPLRFVSLPESCSVKLPPRLKSLPESSSVELPPSFTSWLRSCDILEPIELDDGLMHLPSDGNIESPDNVHSSSHDLKGQVTAWLLDPTFQDFIFQVEKVWDELQEALVKDV